MGQAGEGNMRFGSYRYRGRIGWGIEHRGEVHLAPRADAWPATLIDVLELGRERALQFGERLQYGAGELADPQDLRFLAPLPRPRRNVMCLGLNYRDHAEEFARATGKPPSIPEHPIVFTKAPNAVTGPRDDVPIDDTVTSQVDWEVELGVVIGRHARKVPLASALDCVFGYTVINDLSARDLQRRHGQFFLGKSLDRFCPMGPTVVTTDEIPDPQTLALTCRVNGDVMQQGSTADQIFGVAEVIHRLSHILALEPGDVIATGTPAGVGYGRTPPRFLAPGDVVECEIENIGLLRNRMIDASEGVSGG